MTKNVIMTKIAINRELAVNLRVHHMEEQCRKSRVGFSLPTGPANNTSKNHLLVWISNHSSPPCNHRTLPGILMKWRFCFTVNSGFVSLKPNWRDRSSAQEESEGLRKRYPGSCHKWVWMAKWVKPLTSGHWQTSLYCKGKRKGHLWGLKWMWNDLPHPSGSPHPLVCSSGLFSVHCSQHQGGTQTGPLSACTG